MDIAKNGSYANECYYKYYSEHEHFTKIVYANMLKRHFLQHTILCKRR